MSTLPFSRRRDDRVLLSQNGMQEFLKKWDENYKYRIEKIQMFDAALTKQWSLQQKQLFVNLLYHQRAHFDDILWYMGCFAPDAKTKDLIIRNIKDEFGGNAPSHEKLYLDFAKSLGVNLADELLEEKFYFDFLKEYNRGHLKWLRDHDWDHKLAAFAAIERLDNLDYVALRNIAVSFETAAKDLIFFNVHIHVTHYNDIEDSIFLEYIGNKPDVINTAFNFIGDYQVKIWERISDEIFNYQDA